MPGLSDDVFSAGGTPMTVGEALAEIDRRVSPLAGTERVALAEADGRVHKVEGLAVRDVRGDRVQLLAVVDDDDPDTPSVELDLRVELA